MKKKWMLLLALGLGVSGACISVSGAETLNLSDGTAEVMPEEDILSGEETGLQKEILTDNDDETSAGEISAEITSSREGGVAKWTGACVSEEIFRKWEKGEEISDAEWESMEWQGCEEPLTFSEFLSQLSGTNTGYCMIQAEEGSQNGFADIEVPSGFTAGFIGADMGVNSIASDGNTVLEVNIYTPGELRLLEGKGTVEIKNNVVQGTITGEGAKDTLIMGGDWGRIGGIRDVECIKFTDYRNSLEVAEGPVELYEIQKDSINRDNENDCNLYLNMEGYKDTLIPVIHSVFDFGINTGTDEEGNVFEEPAGIGVHYVEDFEQDEWRFIDIGEGSQAVRYNMKNDVEVLDTSYKMWVGGDASYGIDMDGTTIFQSAFNVDCFKNTEEMTAEEAFEADGNSEYPEECRQYVGSSGTLDNAMRRIAANEKKGNGTGYYAFNFAPDYEVKGTWSVPEGIKGLKSYAYEEYDEQTDTKTVYSPEISSVYVPAGTKLSIMNFAGGSGSFDITGEGITEFMGCRMNQNVSSTGTVMVTDSVLKSLACNKLISNREWSRLVIEDSLRFKEGQFNSPVIYGLPGAVFDMGVIDNRNFAQEGAMEIYLGREGEEKAFVAFNGGYFPGVKKSDAQNGQTVEEEMPLIILNCDTARAKEDGASFTENCYDINYIFDWKSEEDYFGMYLFRYTETEECLASFSEAAFDGMNFEKTAFIFDPENGGMGTVDLQPRFLFADNFEPSDNGIQGEKFKMSYYNPETEKMVKSEKYILVSGEKRGVIQEQDGKKFLMVNGEIAKDVHGLWYFNLDRKWYFLSYGQVQEQFTGVTMYDNEFFYIKDGVLDTDVTGLVPYDGGTFLFAEGRLLNKVNGLWQDIKEPDNWYFLAQGQVQEQHSGVAMYDNAFFVVNKGMLDKNYNGIIEYDGAKFNVVGGQLIVK